MMSSISFKNALRMATVLLLGAAILLAPAPDAPADSAPATSSGILPLADYSGNYAKRSNLIDDSGESIKIDKTDVSKQQRSRV